MCSASDCSSSTRALEAFAARTSATFLASFAAEISWW